MRPSVDAVLMIDPPPRLQHVRERGAARPEDRGEVRRDREVPLVFGGVDEPARHLDRRVVVEHVEPAAARSTVAATIASQSVRRDTSACTAIAVPPSLRRAATVSAAPSSSMSTTRSRRRARANSSAAARPCPDAAPVISATLPASTASSGTTSDRRQHSDACQRGAPAGCVAPRRIARLGLRCSVPTDPIAEYGALFERDGERFVPTPLGRGPWDPERAARRRAERAVRARVRAHDPGPAAFVARLTVELLRPVPLAPLQAVARTIRPGRKVQWLEGDAARRRRRGRARDRAAAASEEVDVADAVSPRSPRRRPFPPAHRRRCSSSTGTHVGYWNANDVRLVRGGFGAPGPAQRVVPAAVPGRRGRAGRAVRAGRRGRRLRQRRRQPAARSRRASRSTPR